MANERLINSVSVGVVYVGGQGDYAISNEEKVHIAAKVQDGLEDMAANEPDAKINWIQSTLSVNIPNITPWAGAHWPGLPEGYYKNIDATLWSDTNQRIYFFRGNEYVRINPSAGWAMEAGYPKPIAGNWPGLPANFNNGIDASLWSEPNQRIYLFKGNEYVRINPSVSWSPEAGYPKPIAGNWPGFPADFANGVDASLWSQTNQRIYFFKGDQYIRVNPAAGWAVEAGYPKPIKDNWPGLPDDYNDGINAAFYSKPNNRIYLFNNHWIVGTYIRINPSVSWSPEAGYPKPVGVGWGVEDQWRDPALNQLGYPSGGPGIEQLTAFFQNATGAQYGYVTFFTKFPTVHFAYASGLKIVMRKSGGSFLDWSSIDYIQAHETGHIFGAPDEYSASNCKCDSMAGKFFSVVNGNCATCNMASVNCLMKNNTVDQLCEWTPAHFGWEAFLAKIDATLYSHTNNKIYMFNEKYYLRFNGADWKLDSGYPKLISGNWPGFPADFANGVDAALWNQPSQRIYFFKGNQYIRVNPAAGWAVEAGYPKPIAGNWPGMPADFANGIDAAVYSKANSRIYIFKGNQYVRINPSLSWAVEAGYPKAIAGNWPGFPADFAAGVDSALWGDANSRIYFFKGTRYIRVNPAAGWNVEAGYPKFINKNWNMPFPE